MPAKIVVVVGEGFVGLGRRKPNLSGSFRIKVLELLFFPCYFLLLSIETGSGL
jgi:hypothetical protein